MWGANVLSVLHLLCPQLWSPGLAQDAALGGRDLTYNPENLCCSGLFHLSNALAYLLLYVCCACCRYLKMRLDGRICLHSWSVINQVRVLQYHWNWDFNWSTVQNSGFKGIWDSVTGVQSNVLCNFKHRITKKGKCPRLYVNMDKIHTDFHFHPLLKQTESWLKRIAQKLTLKGCYIHSTD